MTGNLFLDLLILAVPAAGLSLWWTGARARELATEHARVACRRHNVQFLDQTVALERIAPARSSTGSACLRRTFTFEFTDHVAFRDRAHVTMRGPILVRVNFPWRRDEEGNRVLEH